MSTLLVSEPSETLTDVLERSVEDATLGRSAVTESRHRRVLAHLRVFLDVADLDGLLDPAAAATLQVERDHRPEGAFERVLGPRELLQCLPEFAGPRWLATAAPERRTQLAFIDYVSRELSRSLPVGSRRALLARVRLAVQNARST